MPGIKNAAFVLVILVGTLLLTACPKQTNIARINSDPSRYRGKEVSLTGRVTDSFGVAGQGAYELDDGTGRIWVATREGIPSRGAQVGTRGNVRTGFTFGGRSFGTIIEETERRSKGR